jgi:hypothetical protein
VEGGDEHLPQLKYLLSGLEGLVVGELNHVRFGRKERLVDIDLGVDVDGVVSNIEELDDFWLRELLDNAFPGRSFLLLLARGLYSQKTLEF